MDTSAQFKTQMAAGIRRDFQKAAATQHFLQLHLRSILATKMTTREQKHNPNNGTVKTKPERFDTKSPFVTPK